MPALTDALRPQNRRQLVVTESISTVTSDSSDTWVRLASHFHDIDLNPAKRAKAIKNLEELYVQSPLTKRIVTWMVDFIAGRSFQLTSPSPEASAIVTEFWNSPSNGLRDNLRFHIQELLVYGELAFAVKVNPSTGFCGVTFIPSSQIAEVYAKDGQPGVAESFETLSRDKYRIIQWNHSTQRWDGDAFLFRINRLGGHLRGYPDIVPLLDWISIFETATYNRLERDALLNGIWWDVTAKGKTQEEIEAWYATHANMTPKPGSAIYHNEGVTWTLVQPRASAAMSRDAEFFVNYFMSSAGLLGLNSGENTETAGELVDPVVNSLASRQLEIHRFFTMMGRFAVQEAISAGRLPRGDYEIQATTQRIGVRDIQRSAGAVLRLVSAIQTAQTLGWIDGDQARRIFNELLYRLDLVDKPVTKFAEDKESLVDG